MNDYDINSEDILKIDEQKIKIIKKNSTYYLYIKNEDYTLGNLLVEELNNSEKIEYASCKIKHPLDNILIIIFKNFENDDLLNLQNIIENLIKKITNLEMKI